MQGRIERTELANGKIVSTVCLSDRLDDLDPLSQMMTQFADATGPLVGRLQYTGLGDYETMVFPEAGNWVELEMIRSETEEEARKVHQQMVEKWADQ